MSEAAYKNEVGMVLPGSPDISIGADSTSMLTENFPTPALLATGKLLAVSVCIHTTQVTPAVDVCCPGPSICASLGF